MVATHPFREFRIRRVDRAPHEALPEPVPHVDIQAQIAELQAQLENANAAGKLGPDEAAALAAVLEIDARSQAILAGLDVAAERLLERLP